MKQIIKPYLPSTLNVTGQPDITRPCQHAVGPSLLHNHKTASEAFIIHQQINL
jgi:hypothetical protein